MVRQTLIDLDLVELDYYQFMVSIDDYKIDIYKNMSSR